MSFAKRHAEMKDTATRKRVEALWKEIDMANSVLEFCRITIGVEDGRPQVDLFIDERVKLEGGTLPDILRELADRIEDGGGKLDAIAAAN